MASERGNNVNHDFPDHEVEGSATCLSVSQVVHKGFVDEFYPYRRIVYKKESEKGFLYREPFYIPATWIAIYKTVNPRIVARLVQRVGCAW